MALIEEMWSRLELSPLFVAASLPVNRWDANFNMPYSSYSSLHTSNEPVAGPSNYQTALPAAPRPPTVGLPEVIHADPYFQQGGWNSIQHDGTMRIPAYSQWNGIADSNEAYPPINDADFWAWYQTQLS